jgi:hypothetical protein
MAKPSRPARNRTGSSAGALQANHIKDETPGLNRPTFSVSEIRERMKKLSVEELTDLLQKAGFGPNLSFTEWSDYRFRILDPFHIEADLRRLESFGIKKETLAIATLLINVAPALDDYFLNHFGDKRARLRQAKALTAPIPVLETLAELFGDLPNPMAGGIVPPKATIESLRLYASMMIWGDRIYDFCGANSFLEIAKYAFAGLVRRKTNKFHDREVSAITGAALQDYDYDETAHRVWRIRTYTRLEESFPIAPTLLQALDNLLSQS